MIGTLPCQWRPSPDKALAQCRVLWLTVIYNAVYEYRCGSSSADYFLFSDSGDLEIICELAGVKAAAVRDVALRQEQGHRLQFVPYKVRQQREATA